MKIICLKIDIDAPFVIAKKATLTNIKKGINLFYYFKTNEY